MKIILRHVILKPRATCLKYMLITGSGNTTVFISCHTINPVLLFYQKTKSPNNDNALRDHLLLKYVPLPEPLRSRLKG